MHSSKLNIRFGVVFDYLYRSSTANVGKGERSIQAHVTSSVKINPLLLKSVPTPSHSATRSAEDHAWEIAVRQTTDTSTLHKTCQF